MVNSIRNALLHNLRSDTMEPVEFKAKMNDVGYNFAQFARLCGVNRSTIIRYCQGAYTPIPTVYCNILNWLEDGQLKVSKPKKEAKTAANKKAKPKSKDTLDD